MKKTCTAPDCSKPFLARGFCVNHYMVARRASNPEVREAGRIATLRYSKANREKTREASRAWALANPERVKQNNQKWKADNKEHCNAYMRQWVLDNPEQWNAHRNQRRALSKGASGRASSDQIAARVAMFGGKCAYCRTAPHEAIDHVIPLSRGGSNWPANLRPVCRPCNSSKSDKTLSEWRAA